MDFIPNYPIEYIKYAVMYKNKLEKIGQPLYDTVTYVSGTSTRLTFFDTVRATPDLGNMDVPSQLAGKAFLVRSMRFFAKQRPRSVARAASTNANTGALDNIAQLINTGVFFIKISSKDYAQFPLWLMTAGAGAFGALGVEGATADPGAAIDYAQNGIPDNRNVFSLAVPIFIPPNINFQGRIEWPAALTLAGGNTDLCVLLDGDLLRPVQ
jgi:hypothetical protein